MKTLTPFIIAPFVYFLVMNNTISATCQSDVVTALEFISGMGIFLGSLALGVVHHNNSTTSPEERTQINLGKKLIDYVKKFTFKNPPSDSI